jgi:hypothetical protein
LSSGNHKTWWMTFRSDISWLGVSIIDRHGPLAL